MLNIKLTQAQIENWVAKNFEYKRRKNGEELLICNPFVPGDNKFKFNISTIPKSSKKSKHLNYWVHDWRPSASQYNGSFIKFVQRYKGCTFKEAIKDVCGSNVDLKSILDNSNDNAYFKSHTTQNNVRLELPDNAVKITDEKWGKIRNIAINYLNSRGINYQDAVSFRIHYTPTMVIFPYLEYDDIVYWQGRSFSPLIKKFEFPDQNKVGVGKSEFIYGFDNAESGCPVYITEAIFDALTIGPGGLAIGGAKLSETQRKKIRAINPSYVVLAPDNDTEGMASIYSNWQLLNQYHDLYYIIPKDSKDWNEKVKQANDKQEELNNVRNHIHNNIKKLTMAEAIKFRMISQG